MINYCLKNKPKLSFLELNFLKIDFFFSWDQNHPCSHQLVKSSVANHGQSYKYNCRIVLHYSWKLFVLLRQPSFYHQRLQSFSIVNQNKITKSLLVVWNFSRYLSLVHTSTVQKYASMSVTLFCAMYCWQFTEMWENVCIQVPRGSPCQPGHR